MFKKLNTLEKTMFNLLNTLNRSNNCHELFNHFDIDTANAFHVCLKNEYVENVDEFVDGNGNYHFSSLGNTHVNEKGLKFIRDMFFKFRLKTCIFEILKGTLGFLLGILSTVIAEIIIFLITHSEEISKFLP